MDSILHIAHGNQYDVMEATSKYPRSHQYQSIYNNYPEKGERLFSEKIVKNFYYTEPMTRIEWELLDNDTTIIEYPCHAACGNYGGHRWTVYYTQELPFSVGPWKLWGLPGVILYAYDDTGNNIFEGIEVRKGDHIYKMPNLKNAIKCTKEAWKKLNIEVAKDPEYIAKKLYGQSTHGIGADGKPIVYKQKTPIFLED